MLDNTVLLGAHTVGHVHTKHSGFGFLETEAVLRDSPMTNAWDESPNRFDHQYWLSLVIELWQNHQEKFQGSTVKTFSDKSTNFWIVNAVNNPGVTAHPSTVSNCLFFLSHLHCFFGRVILMSSLVVYRALSTAPLIDSNALHLLYFD
jgi:hypothetical protein